MWVNFFGRDRAYHDARRRFVFKGKASPRVGLRRALVQMLPQRLETRLVNSGDTSGCGTLRVQ